MTEQEAVRMVQGAPEGATDLKDSYWREVDPTTLDKCFDKGFIRWVGARLDLTPLGRRSCGGTHYASSSLSKNERF